MFELLVQRALVIVARAHEANHRAEPCPRVSLETALVAVGMPVTTVINTCTTQFVDECSTKVHTYLCYLDAEREAARLKIECIENGLLADSEPF